MRASPRLIGYVQPFLSSVRRPLDGEPFAMTRRFTMLLLIAAVTQQTPGIGRTTAPDVAAEPVADGRPVARVNGRPITAAAVTRFMQQRGVQHLQQPAARRAAREALICREAVFQYLQRTALAATPAEVDQRPATLQKPSVVPSDSSTADPGPSPAVAAYRQEVAWQIVWQRYCDDKLTPENLKKFYRDHQAAYDGSTLQASHILLRVSGEPKAAATVLRRAEEIRGEVVAGKLTFAEAARRYSESPSAERGGELGWIERRYPMDEAFSAAAFGLDRGAISEPVVTSAGVHLIQITDRRPGRRTLRDVRPAVRADAEKFLLKWLTEQVLPKADIERGPD
jgi:hypothetical protein